MMFPQYMPSLRNAPYQFIYICVVFTFVLVMLTSESQGCFLQSKNEKKFGETYPTGDIVLHIGDPLELFCTLNPEAVKEINCTVDNLIFYKDTKPVDARYQTRINETTIRLYIENQTESESMYYCYLQFYLRSDSQFNSLEVTTNASIAIDHSPSQEMVCMNWVAVGQEPRDIDNYTCISLNWQVLNCSWNVPKNYVKTSYKIEYTPKHRYSERMACPTDDDIRYNFCTWTLRSTPIYRKNFDTLKIIITGMNKFKSNEQTFFFNHFGHILMDPPKGLKMLAKNTTSITLQWDIGDLQYFPRPLHYKILYMYNNSSDWDTTYCDSKNSTKVGGKITCTIAGLICNKVYNFRVFTKSSLASDKYWSNYTSQLFTTSVSRPAHAPNTDIGSFQLEDIGSDQMTRTAFVYWQPLKIAEQCGDNFTYDISAFEVNEDGSERPATDIKRIDAVGSYAKFEVGAFRYRFEIRSVNKEGVAPGASSVIVPAVGEKVPKCGLFTKTDYQQTTNCTNLYELSWQPPNQVPAIDNYTIFWCQSDKERPYQCNGYVQWKNIVSNVSKEDVCINSTDTYQFAISANVRHSSSGMLWATCSVPHDHVGTVRQVYAPSAGPTHIEVAWKLECVDQGSTIKGFNVSYCLLAEPSAMACVPNTNHTVRWWSNNTLLTGGNLTGLQPYSHYKVTICMFNAAGREGQSSVPVVLNTTEGAPNINGVKLNWMSRTNTSVTIGWEPPRQMNGELRYYLVVWSQQQQEVKVYKKTQWTITNLDPYTKYYVTVRACTSVCSPEMKPIEVSTRVGKPGKVETITVEQQDQGTLVKWDPPIQLSGPHPLYEVLVLKDNMENLVNQTNDTQMLLPKPDCSTDHNAKYEVRVRAINVDNDPVDGNAGVQSPVIYLGDKSPAYLLNCTDGVSMLWKIFMWTTFPVLLMVLVGYGSRQLYYKCRQMKNVHVTIPMKFLPHPPDSKGEDPFGPNYTQVVPPRQADEFSTLFDKTVEQSG